MADLVSHPDEVKVVSRRFGQGATNIDRYLELDGYKAVQKALAMAWRSGILDWDEVVIRSQAVGETQVRAV
jgi:hypothetical protein